MYVFWGESPENVDPVVPNFGRTEGGELSTGDALGVLAW